MLALLHDTVYCPAFNAGQTVVSENQVYKMQHNPGYTEVYILSQLTGTYKVQPAEWGPVKRINRVHIKPYGYTPIFAPWWRSCFWVSQGPQVSLNDAGVDVPTRKWSTKWSPIQPISQLAPPDTTKFLWSRSYNQPHQKPKKLSLIRPAPQRSRG